MRRFSAFLRQHVLWLGFLAAFVPLVLLVALQYVWLTRLEEVTAIANRAALDACVEAVGSEVHVFYRSQAERALDLPAAAFREGLQEKVARHWADEPVEGIRTLFVVDYTRALFGDFYVYDREREALEVPPASEEALAMIVASTPWQALRYRGMIAEKASLTVDERDAEHRIVLKPITDEDSRVVGVAGMIIDEDHFRTELLPSVADGALAFHFPRVSREDLVLTIRDGEGRAIFASCDGPVTRETVSARFPFVFADWSVGLTTRGQTHEDWARTGFGFNMTLTALLALTLLGGVLLALRTANRAMRLSEMKSDFVSNVSHELRTPLASIRVFAEFLKLGHAEQSGKAREYGEHIEAESRRLSRLIENILDFSSIESGRKSYRFVEGNLEEVASSVVESFRVRVQERGFQIALDVPEEPLPAVHMDPDAIGQAFHNLLDNAVKYSGDSRMIIVRLERDGNAVIGSVEDRGVGIARGEQRKVFDRFHRVGTSLVHDVKGSGLGLSIVQHIVHAHGGEASVESAPGRGTTVRIRLPIAGAESREGP